MEEKKEQSKSQQPQEETVKKETPKEEKKTEKPIAEDKKAKTETPAEEKPKKNKKINKMNLAEVEEKLKLSREKMGAYDGAQYVQELLKRREALTRNKELQSE